MRKVRFLDGFKAYYHTGGCYAHYTGFMAVVPLAYGVMEDTREQEEKLWFAVEYAKKAIYQTQVIFIIRSVINALEEHAINMTIII